ncbi:OVARIAN TUMOR DOMAIN-containing deubiquitinating enzyme 10-like [Lathyrus oleraceus]|uniref:OVARIAN TUMOR DOMAIN-containing deubiquitinating enzyme 10-like n=1 Tax=Pisum sativum TaxID=3888 RepID=UPI0021D3B363|nr:OVARIAN TUMOR DOMAIN-containing deubiquitinating enzyme 10-like [Pisum sativum]
MKLPSQSVKTKGAPKKRSLHQIKYLNTQSPSYFEHVDNVFPDSSTPKSQKSVVKGVRISKPPPMPILPKIPFIDEMPVFMHKYIERVVNVVGEGNCSYRAVSALLDKGEDNHTHVRHQLIQELKTHKESYI